MINQFNASIEVRIPKTAEVVASKIRRAIMSGQLPVGGNLPSEGKLIAMFEVSRPTIREAVRILEVEDLISISRGARGGAEIKAPSYTFVSRAMGSALQARLATLGDIYLARTLIEPPAARLAAETRPRKAAEVLKKHVEAERIALEQSPTIPALTADFHRLLVEQSGNTTLALIAIALREIVEKHLALRHRSAPASDLAAARKQTRLGIRSHQRLVELIEAGDGARAEAHWRAHMDKAGEFWLDHMAQTSVVDVLES